MDRIPLTSAEIKELKDKAYSKGYLAGTKYGRRTTEEIKPKLPTISPGTSKIFRAAIKTLVTTDENLPLNEDEVDILCQHSAFALSLAQSMEADNE